MLINEQGNSVGNLLSMSHDPFYGLHIRRVVDNCGGICDDDLRLNHKPWAMIIGKPFT
ncbi:MAG: hypothetical protein ACE3JK_16980 [Sporolactobacillus sp.]